MYYWYGYWIHSYWDIAYRIYMDMYRYIQRGY
jgi:hypothetical protein